MGIFVLPAGYLYSSSEQSDVHLKNSKALSFIKARFNHDKELLFRQCNIPKIMLHTYAHTFISHGMG